VTRAHPIAWSLEEVRTVFAALLLDAWKEEFPELENVHGEVEVSASDTLLHFVTRTRTHYYTFTLPRDVLVFGTWGEFARLLDTQVVNALWQLREWLREWSQGDWGFLSPEPALEDCLGIGL